MYPFERFTEGAKKTLTLAQSEAESMRSLYIGTEHLLLGFLRLPEFTGGKILASLGVQLEEIRQAIDNVLGHPDRIVVQQLIPTTRVKTVIEIAFDLSGHRSEKFVGTEHLLLGLLSEGEGIAARILLDRGITLDSVNAELERLASEPGFTPEDGSSRPHSPQSPMPVPGGDELEKLMAIARDEAFQHGRAPTAEDMLVAILIDDTSLAARILREHGIDLDDVRKRISEG